MLHRRTPKRRLADARLTLEHERGKRRIRPLDEGADGGELRISRDNLGHHLPPADGDRGNRRDKPLETTSDLPQSTYISLDGVVELPHEWPTIERPSDERGDEIQTSLLMACDAVLMGRRTYESFAPAWQARAGDPLSDRINVMPKYVVSTTLTDRDGANTTVISSDVAKRIQELKEEPGQDIVQYGFGAVSTLLMQHGLLDELRLWIHPLFVGKGSTDDILFPKAPPTQFILTDSTILESGTTILSYRLA